MSRRRGGVVRAGQALGATLRRAPAPAVLSVSLLGWTIMVWLTSMSAAHPHTALVVQGGAGHVGHATGAVTHLPPGLVPTLGMAMWLAMVLAMSPLLLLREVSHLWRGSLRRTRRLTLLVFTSGYGLVWLLGGLVALPFAHALGDSRLLIGLTVVAVLVWQCSPLRQACLNVCHRTPPLRVFGAAARADAWRYGVVAGSACAASCGPIMVLVLLATEAHLAAMSVATTVLVIERYRPARRPRWRIPFAPARPEHVALPFGPQVEQDLAW
ncbi:MAG: DUF2182 domain-containing protein [Dermatophilaceae bacterium]